ncbi:preprotein translocase subunit YajC [Pseudofrankia sp. BMG5.37]|uniref:preprotein translocase subunit YajC n=1 Tax=Pseudofrankia sp. BMG5.37 TaxID=3050035 RepID=UPI0028952C5C|nr:preprotein translocase subunit YajC [Pseudofrankia sp. BMG5.37]MDT3445321.1 preprotein translocase subunit YajC [Pseudofrankia sp. BMG5.37]
MATAAIAAGDIAADDKGGGGAGSWLLPILIILVGVYFFTIQRRRSRANQQEQSKLGPGSLIITRGGLYGTVVEVDGQDVLLEIAPDVVCRFSRGAIGRIVSTPTTGADEDTAQTPDDEAPSADASPAGTPTDEASAPSGEPTSEERPAPGDAGKSPKKEL